MTPDANDLCVFAVKRGYIESKEIYCNPLYPTYLSLVEKYQHSPYANGILNNHVAVNPKTDCSLLSDSSEVSFVPMANVQEKTNVVSYDMVAYETVKKGFTVFQRGDLIWAKITPKSYSFYWNILQCPFLPIMDTTQKALQSIHTWLSTKCFRRITNMYSSR